jgi:hypothetical protein
MQLVQDMYLCMYCVGGTPCKAGLQSWASLARPFPGSGCPGMPSAQCPPGSFAAPGVYKDQTGDRSWHFPRLSLFPFPPSNLALPPFLPLGLRRTHLLSPWPCLPCLYLSWPCTLGCSFTNPPRLCTASTYPTIGYILTPGCVLRNRPHIPTILTQHRPAAHLALPTYFASSNLVALLPPFVLLLHLHPLDQSPSRPRTTPPAAGLALPFICPHKAS